MVLTGGEYWVGSLVISGHGNLSVQAKSVLNVNSASISGSNARVNFGVNQIGNEVPQNPGDLYIIQHATDGNVAMSGGMVSAYVISHLQVTMSGNAYLNGAVTTKYLTMSGNARINGDLNGCNVPDTKKLVITPKTAYGLTCDRIPVNFEVQKSDGSIDTGFVGNMSVTPNSNPNGDICWSATPNGICEPGSASIPISGGQRVLYLQSKNIGNVDVAASVATDSGSILQASAGPYHFAPFGFRINDGQPVQMIAGKETSVKVEAVASQGASCSVIEDYGKVSGENKKLVLGSLKYVRPETEHYVPTIQGKDIATGEEKEINVSFTKGVGYLSTQYRDAGELQFTLKDEEWQPQDCDDDDCEDHEGDWEGLNGTGVIYSRPYTFALCNIHAGDQTTFFGNANDPSSAGFTAAGNKFSVTFKPVSYPDFSHSQDNHTGDGEGEVITAENRWCNGDWATPNYYQVKSQHLDAPLGISISEKPHSPEKGVKGELTGSLIHQYLNSSQAIDGIKVDDLSWNDVGSLWLKANGRYFGQDINTGLAAIGRFYPRYLKLESDSFSYPTGQNRFAYMDQSLTIGFRVGAYASGHSANGDEVLGNTVKNYHRFALGLKAPLSLMTVDTTKAEDSVNSLSHRLERFSNKGQQYKWQWGGSSWGAGALGQSQLGVTESNFTFIRDYVKNPETGVLTHRGDLQRFSVQDGPYDQFNTRFGLAIGSVKDPLDWFYLPDQSGEYQLKEVTETETRLGQVWMSRPDIRYGRMALEDVSGRFDSELSIPLRVEYWDGLDFVTNKQDSVSAFNGDLSCKQILSQSDTAVTSTSYTNGSGNVEYGDTRSGEFDAVPTEAKDDDGNVLIYREQVRFWQKVIGDKPMAIDEEPEIACGAGPSSSQSNYQPWLTFDWRGKGDESPHSTVTFGAYRGNDRVLYRGEKGINTMLN